MTFVMGLLLVGFAAVLGFNRIHDTDAWMHLSLGRLIWQLKGFPRFEVFSYAGAQTPFYYTSWLFGVFVYGIQGLAGATGLVLLKAAASGAAFWVLYRDATRSESVPAVALAVLGLSLVATQSRLVLRPDLVLLVILPAVIYLLNRYLRDADVRHLYALPFLHLLWGNTHSSVIIMAAPFGAMIAGGFAQARLARRGIFARAKSPTGAQLKAMALTFAACFALSLVNPNHVGQYLYGAGLLGSGFKQDIGELLPPIGAARIVLMAAVGLCALSFAVNRRRFSVAHAMLAAAFSVLPFVSVRFIFLFAIVVGPIAARNFSQWLHDRDMARHFNRPVSCVLAVVLVAGPCTAAIMRMGPFGAPHFTLGTGFDLAQMPAGAVRYLDENNIEGRVLNTFSFGQYIIWTGYPGRTVFMDARGNIPRQDWEMLREARSSQDVLDRLYGRYGFESMVLDYPATTLFSDPTGSHYAVGVGQRVFHMMDHPRWALVYWDDVSIVLVRRDGPYGRLAARDGYRFVRPDDDPENIVAAVRAAPGPAAVELSRVVRESGSGFARMLLGVAMHAMGRYPEALRMFSEVPEDLRVGDADPVYVALTLSGDIYMQQGDLPSALRSFTRALGHTQDAHFGLGLVNAKMGRKREAIDHFRAFLATNPSKGFRASAERQIDQLSK